MSRVLTDRLPWVSVLPPLFTISGIVGKLTMLTEPQFPDLIHTDINTYLVVYPKDLM